MLFLLSLPCENRTEEIVENTSSRSWIEVYRNIWPFTWRWNNIDRWMVEISIIFRRAVTFEDRPLPSPRMTAPTPVGEKKPKRHSSGNYNLDVDGRYLVIDCIEFVVIINREERIVEVQGSSVDLQSIWEAGNVWNREGFLTTPGAIKRQRQSPEVSFECEGLVRNDASRSYCLYCSGGMQVHFSRENRKVHAIGAAVKGQYKNTVYTIGGGQVRSKLFPEIAPVVDKTTEIIPPPGANLVDQHSTIQ
ncbi:MAG: hypothetical protein KW804_00920 [Candidatus Doudnabacteria bacterium]|nr:hypothetical protein [Candidatus Doudnabacteria bacterium]